MVDDKYKNFRDSVRVRANRENWDFETKDELKTLLGQKGFHMIRDKESRVKYNEPATEKQVDKVWEWLKHEQEAQQKIDNYTVHTYLKRIILRANSEQTIKGKKYRKGQFIPKKRD